MDNLENMEEKLMARKIEFEAGVLKEMLLSVREKMVDIQAEAEKIDKQPMSSSIRSAFSTVLNRAEQDITYLDKCLAIVEESELKQQFDNLSVEKKEAFKEFLKTLDD